MFTSQEPCASLWKSLLWPVRHTQSDDQQGCNRKNQLNEISQQSKQEQNLTNNINVVNHKYSYAEWSFTPCNKNKWIMRGCLPLCSPQSIVYISLSSLCWSVFSADKLVWYIAPVCVCVCVCVCVRVYAYISRAHRVYSTFQQPTGHSLCSPMQTVQKSKQKCYNIFSHWIKLYKWFTNSLDLFCKQ